MSPELLVLMAKYPTRGRVKTRLAREIGTAAATKIYRLFLAGFVKEFSDVRFDVEWRYTPLRAPFRRIAGNDYIVRPQPHGDLGSRLRRIFEQSFARGYRRVVVIGTDAPEVGRDIVRRAFGLLKSHRAVFQPTFDGGYALIGLDAVIDVFSNISWSSSKVMTQTRRRLNGLGVDFAELPPTFDVDTKEDLERLRSINSTLQ